MSVIFTYTPTRTGRVAAEPGIWQSEGVVLICCVCIIVPQQCKKSSLPPIDFALYVLLPTL